MFILDITPVGPDGIERPDECHSHSASGKQKENTRKPPQAERDEFVKDVSSDRHGFENVIRKFRALGFSDETTSQVPEDACCKSGRRLSDYSSNRFVFVRAHRYSSLEFEKLVKGLSDRNEMLLKLYEERMKADQESREIEKVFMILTFSTANPTGVISSLKNLIPGLRSAAAKSIAGGAIGQIEGYESARIKSLARYGEVYAKVAHEAANALVQALGGIGDAVCRNEHSDMPGMSHDMPPGEVTGPMPASYSHAPDCSNNIKVEKNPEVKDEVYIFDRQQNQYVDYVDMSDIMPMGSEESHVEACNANNDAVKIVNQSRLYAEGTEKETDRLLYEYQKERLDETTKAKKGPLGGTFNQVA